MSARAPVDAALLAVVLAAAVGAVAPSFAGAAAPLPTASPPNGERSTQAPPPDDEARRRAVDAVFDAWDRWDTPGAAVVVVRDGEVFYQRGYGSAQLEYGIPITPATVFHVASVSKQFTTMAIELLARDGELSWDDELRRWLPDQPDYGVPITLRQLANHTSGIRDQWELLAMAGWRLDDVITRDQILKMARRQRELNFPPGSEHLYCNTGYTLLAEVVARASGQSLRDFAAARIFRPLGMAHTRVHDDHEEIVPGRAYSYAPRDGGGWRNSVLSFANAGATSLFTTVADLARWLRNFETGEIGGPAAIRELTSPGVLASGETIDYALGLAPGTYRGTPSIAHGGSDAGFRTFLLWLPEQRLGVAVLSNLASFDAGGAAQQVVDAVIGDRLAPREAPSGAAATLESRPRFAAPAELLAEYLGAYQLDIGALVTIERRGLGLAARLPDGNESALVALAENELRAQANGALLRFERDPGRPAPGFTAELGGQTYVAKRVQPIAVAGLAGLVGEYWSEELETGYRLALDGDSLVARHARHPDVHLYALAADALAGDTWWFARVDLTRDRSGTVDGFRLTGSRVRNVRFRRR